jgi:DNA anti-recombination protein RmuC
MPKKEMPKKEKIQEEVEQIAKEGKEMKEKFTSTIEKNYRKMLEEAGDAADAASKTTREMLNAVEEGLKGAGDKSEYLFEEAVMTMSRVAAEVSDKAVTSAREYADKARDAFNDALDAAGNSVEEAQDTAKETMDKAYADWHKVSEQQLARMKEFSEEIREFTAEKSYRLSALTRKTVKEQVKRMQDEAQSLEESTTEYSKKLLHDSREAVADWLSEMAKRLKSG